MLASAAGSFSILERIDVGETRRVGAASGGTLDLSVSSNGSTWVKPGVSPARLALAGSAFSILERIDVGETTGELDLIDVLSAFSILERIDVGETSDDVNYGLHFLTFQYPRTDRRG